MFYQPSHRFVDPLHKHGQEEDCSDGRGQVAGHRLDVVEELAALSCLDHGDPADADGHDAQDPDSGQGRRQQDGPPRFARKPDALASPAHDDELSLGGLGPDASPDVHGEQGAATVEDGGQRGHESSQHDRQHQTSQACRERSQEGGVSGGGSSSCLESPGFEKFRILEPPGRLRTVGHDRHHQFRVSNVGAAHRSSTHPLTHLRDNTADIVYG